MGFGIGRHENFEAAAEARHNRGQLARRLYHLRLNEVSRQSHLLVRSIDRAADQFHFIARFDAPCRSPVPSVRQPHL